MLDSGTIVGIIVCLVIGVLLLVYSGYLFVETGTSWGVGALLAGIFFILVTIITLPSDLHREYEKRIPTINQQLREYDVSQARLALEEAQEELESNDE